MGIVGTIYVLSSAQHAAVAMSRRKQADAAIAPR
jgi:hypothetical protein